MDFEAEVMMWLRSSDSHGRPEADTGKTSCLIADATDQHVL